MSYIAVSVGVAGLATSVYGGIQAGNAAKKAANAQQAAAEDYKKYVRTQQDTAVGLTLNPSALAMHDQALQSQEQNVRRQEDLVRSLDPNIVEAGKQVSQLLQGKSAPVLQNMQNQRNLQRTQLLDTLRQQLGPGAETSSAGQQALTRFDTETANLMSGAQQEYLDKVSNMSLGGAQTLGESISSVNKSLSAINADDPRAKAAQLIAQFTGAGGQAASAGIQAAGGEYAADAIRGQTLSNVGNSAMTLGAMFAGKQMFGGTPGTPATPGADTGAPGAGGTNAEFKMPGLGDSAGYGGAGPGTQPSLFGNTASAPAARTAAGIPSGGSSYSGTLSPNYGIGYADPRFSPYNGQRTFSSVMSGGPQTANIAGY